MEQIQAILDPRKVLLDRHRDRLQQIEVMAGHAVLCLRHLIMVGQQAFQLVGFLDRLNARSRAFGVGNIKQQVLLQIGGQLLFEILLAAIDEFLELTVNLPHEKFGGETYLQGTIAHRLHEAAGQPPEAGGGIAPAGSLQALQYRADFLQRLAGILLPIPGQETHLVLMTQGFRQLPHILASVIPHIIRDRSRQVRREHGILGQQVLAAHGAQIVQQRQQYQRDIAPAPHEPFEIIRKLQHGTHEHVIGIFRLADTAFEQGLGHLLHFLRKQGSPIELYHLQGTEHLVQVRGTETHLRLVIRILDIGLQGLSRLVQGVIQLLLDPAQCAVINRLVHDASFACAAASRRYASVSG